MPLLQPGQALTLWQRALLAQVHNADPDLTVRQMTILLTVYLNPPPHTVRGLAEYLRVTKPVISRALDTMGTMGLVRRKRDEQDRRNVLILRTVDGSLYLQRLGDLIIETAGEVGI